MAFAKSAVLFEILCLSSYSKLKYLFLSHLLIYDILNQMYRKLEVLSLNEGRYATIFRNIGPKATHNSSW